MKRLLILGAGSAGTMMANHLARRLDRKNWELTVVDQEKLHYYQPGFLFLPFNRISEAAIQHPIHRHLPRRVRLINRRIDRIAGEENRVYLTNKQALDYDVLIIATGTRPDPAMTEGLLDIGWRQDIFDFYTFEGARALRDKLATWPGGHLVVHINEMPIKCPVAPLEFAFLADEFFAKKGMRDRVKITYVTPMSGAFTKPVAAKKLGYLLEQKRIDIVSDFYTERIDPVERKVYDYGGKEVDYDLLVTVPINAGDPVIERSGLGDELNFVPTDKHTLQSRAFPNIFVIGDATDLPTSKAGSVAHFEAEILTENILHYLAGEPLSAHFDGHANCFVETGRGKALLIDFNYVQEPVEGTFPIPGLGPLRLLRESRLNHWAKLAFKWIYWHLLLPARKIPFVSAHMSLKGKQITTPVREEVGSEP